MSADRDKMVAQFDELKEKTLSIMEELETLSAETEELRTARREIEEKAWAADEKITKLDADLESKTAKIDALKQKLNSHLSKTIQISYLQEKTKKLRALFKSEMS